MNAILIVILIILNIYLVYKDIKRGRSNINNYFLFLIFSLHFIASILYYKLSLIDQKDSYLFYHNALEADSILEFKIYGSQLMSIISYPFAKMGISYLVLSLLCSTISFYGFLNYYNFLMSRITKNKYLYLYTLFLIIPSLHFWTSGLNKEALIFYLMSVIFIRLHKNHKITLVIVFSSALIFLIRPYLFFILALAFLANYILNFKGTLKQKRTTIIITLLAVITLTPVLFQFLQLTEFSLNKIKLNFASLVDYSKNFGGSSIELENTTYFGRLFLVLFRPLFYDASNFYQYVISFENLILFLFILKFLKDVFVNKGMLKYVKNQVFLFLLVILSILFYSIYMYNLGLASRMRVMFVPFLFLFLFLTYRKTYTSGSE